MWAMEMTVAATYQGSHEGAEGHEGAHPEQVQMVASRLQRAWREEAV